MNTDRVLTVLITTAAGILMWGYWTVVSKMMQPMLGGVAWPN